jgi:hypothetical protein
MPQPHLVTTARQSLVRDGHIEVSRPIRTRGGSLVEVVHLKVVPDLKGRVEDAAARKRLLHARYIGWSRSTTRYPQGYIGTAGERVLRSSIRHSDLAGYYSVLRRDGGDVARVFDAPVEGGSLDDAAWYGGDEAGKPILLLFEEKNIRSWIYPRAPELHQLLFKAARVQQLAGGAGILPVLVCRKRHHTTFQMAKDLGFGIIELHRQFILPVDLVKPEFVSEVQVELGFETLVQTDEADPVLVEILRTALPPYIGSLSRRWADVSPSLENHFQTLRDEALSEADRESEVDQLRGAARAALGGRFGGGW